MIAGINLNPYQGLKLASAQEEMVEKMQGRNQPKPLSGIETFDFFSVH